MSYAENTGHPADFEIHYRFYTAEEGGRRTGPPWQHHRCDWAYEGDGGEQPTIYMIWPEFIAEDRSLQQEGMSVPYSGWATMWIVVPEMRDKVHRERIREGVRGYLMEGPRRIAEAVVTRVLALSTNPSGKQR